MNVVKPATWASTARRSFTPSQIEACNRTFTPTADEVAQARRIIAAFEQPENRRKGVIALDGRMVERLHLKAAHRTVAIADSIAGWGSVVELRSMRLDSDV